MTTYASDSARHASRKAPLRPYTSSAATQQNRSPASARRLTCPIASAGFVANFRLPGIPALRRRAGSFAHACGMYTSKSAHPCPNTVTSAANTQVTQFSTVPVTPACCGDAHAVDLPFFRWAVSSMAIPGPIRSSGSSGRHCAARAGSAPRRVSHDHLQLLTRACIRCGPS